MRNPFIFGHLDEAISFVNRGDDIARLRQNIENRINTIIVSPRRWGKTSLVRVLESKAGLSKKTVFCHLDMFNVNREEDFYSQFSNAVLKASSSKLEEAVTHVKEFLSSLKPSFSFEKEEIGKVSFEILPEHDDVSFLEILDLAEKISIKKNIQMVLCIDEFQNLSRFKDPLLFQQRLRASWQHHKHVTYILYGSKRSMLSVIFEDQSMPFYRFGDVFYLQKIEASHWVKYIQSSFRKTGKKIAIKYARKVTDIMECHSYYVQQFSHILWNNTDTEVDEEIFAQTVKDIIGRNALMFENIYETLSYYQIKALQIIIEEPQSKQTSINMIKKYDMGSSSNVIQAFKALENKEVIDRFEKYTQFVDPVFRMWMLERIM
jgi:AAA+ ATPase superfamily predicted ATPase